MAQGNWLLDADGKWMQIAGNLALSDGAGDACCCGATGVCLTCQTVAATVTLTTATRCFDCVGGNLGRVTIDATLSGSFSLAYAPGASPFACSYFYSDTSTFTITIREYDGGTCTGAICITQTGIGIALARNSTTGKWRLVVQGWPALTPYVFDSGDFDPPGTDDFCWTKTVGNTLVCDNINAAASCSEGGADNSYPPYYSGGTATITVG